MKKYSQSMKMVITILSMLLFLFPAKQVSAHLSQEEKGLCTSSREIGIRGKAYYVFGAHMAKTIEEKLGREPLIQTIHKGPFSFVTTYNSVVEQEEKISVPSAFIN